MQDRAARHEWFKTVILPHEPALRRRVQRITGHSAADIEDIVAEVLTRAYMTEGYQRIDRGRAFIFTVARNLVADLARHRTVVSFELMATFENFDVADPAPSPESAAMARDELRRLQAVVDTLPLQCRQVFLLRRIKDFSLADIAVHLGLSVSTVEKHLSKAMTLLTRGMAENEPVTKDKQGLTWRRKKDSARDQS